jgi:hypothetical protein
MSNMDNRQWVTSIEHNISIPADLDQVANNLCENALADAKGQLHPLLRSKELARLEKRGEFLQAFKSALEQRIARALAAWCPGVEAVFQFDDTRITDMETWDGSIHLLVKVPRISTAVKLMGRKLDQDLVRYLRQLGWQRFGARRSIVDVQQVTWSELRHAIGYGAMFCAVYTVPVQIWPRGKRAE